MTEFISTWVLASLDLRATEAGGLRRKWEVPTPSFLFLFGAVQIGADIFTDDGELLNPGERNRLVVLRFWSPIAPEIVRPGAYFVVEYGDRVIGGGVINAVLEGRPASASMRELPPGWSDEEQT